MQDARRYQCRTLVDIRAAVDVVVVTAWESEFLIPQQTAGGFNVPLVAATLAGMPADDHIAPGAGGRPS